MRAPLGYVVFDNPEAMEHGWAARGDGESARLIGGLHDLSTDTVWIFNSEWDHMHDQQVHHHALYRHCRYFGPALPKIIRDLGVPDTAAQDQAVVGAQIATRVMDLYGRCFGSADVIPANRLALAVRERMAPPDTAIPAELDQALTDSSEMFDWIRDISGVQEEGVDMTLRLHPVLYAQMLLGALIPDDQKEPQWDDHPPQRPTMEWLTAQSPLLARLTIKAQDRMISLLLNFGATGDQGSQRRFVTHYELSRLLASDIDLRIHQTVRWPPDQRRFATLAPLVDHMAEREGGAFLASESVSLFAEVLWRAAATRLVPAHTRRQKTSRYRNLAAPFLHAYGRIACANEAIDLIQDGFLVRRQGYGQIGLLMREGDDWERLAHHCVRHRLIPPVFPPRYALARYHPPEDCDPQDPLVASIVLRIRGLWKDVLQLDAVLSDWAIRTLSS